MLTVKETAGQLKVSIATVYLLCEQRLLPHVRIGVGRGTIRVQEEDLKRFLEKAMVRNDPEPPAGSKSSAGQPFKHLDGERLIASWKRQGVGKGRRSAAKDSTQ